jgi:CheY-like chemotaxis protein
MFSSNSDFSACRTMVVDDSLLDRKIVCASLKRLGIHHITQCCSGREALLTLEEHVPDLIILDIRLGDMSGLDLCQQIRAMPGLESTPIAMQSGLGDIETIKEAFQRGAHDYFIKPLKEEEVAVRLQSMLLLRNEMKERVRHAQELSLLLRKILPEQIARELEDKGSVQSRWCDDAVLMILDFTAASRVALELNVEELIQHFNAQFDAFDTISDHYGITRIKTVGDEYQTVAGLFDDDANIAIRSLAAAFDMRWLVQQWMHTRRAQQRPCWNVRLSVHRGPTAWGVMGNTHLQFDLIGSTINEAHRICTAANDGTIWCSEAIATALQTYASFDTQGATHLRNIGDFALFEVTQLSPDIHTSIEAIIPGHAAWHQAHLPRLLERVVSV